MENQHQLSFQHPSNSQERKNSFHHSRSRSRSINSPSHSHSNSHSRSRHSSRSPQFHDINNVHSLEKTNVPPLPKGPALDFLIFLSKDLERSLTEKEILSKISNKIGGVSMEFDYQFIIPEYNGYLLKIKGNNIKKKRDSAQQLLEFIVFHDLDKPKIGSSRIEIVIMIPNGLVSMVIGTRGKQISNLIKESGANIVINQPIYKMTYRTVTIAGRPANVSNAIMAIQQIMEDRYNEVSKIEFESRPLNVKTTLTIVKLIFERRIIDYLTNNKKQINIIDVLQNQYNVTLKILQDRKNRQLDYKDYICSFQGTIENVQGAIIEVTRRIKNEIRTVFNGEKSYSLRVLINKVLVTKLIGAEGCMIKEIANFSKGASIKIMSNKHDEKKSTCHEIPVCIGGSFSSVQDATCIIIEQIECFKNGGPVLKSGNCLHENIAVQFINSIFTSASSKENEDDHIYTLKDRLLSSKRERDETDILPSTDQQPPQQLPQSSNQPQHPQRSNSSRSHSQRRHHHHHRHSSRSHSNHSHSHSSSRSDQDNIYKSKPLNTRSNDLMNTFSYEENGIMKISTDIIVPDHLVNILIGKKGENVRNIMSKTGASINFSKEYNDDCKINTSNGIGRFCNLKGTPQQNGLAMKMISEMIIKYEPIKIGSRPKK